MGRELPRARLWCRHRLAFAGVGVVWYTPRADSVDPERTAALAPAAICSRVVAAPPPPPTSVPKATRSAAPLSRPLPPGALVKRGRRRPRPVDRAPAG